MLRGGLLVPAVEPLSLFLSFLFFLPFLAAAAVVRRWAAAGEETHLRRRLEAYRRVEEEVTEGEQEIFTAYAPRLPVAGKFCVVCGSPTTSRCSRCKSVRYCSGNCQIIHWRQGHKYVCQPSIQCDVPEKEICTQATSTKSEVSEGGSDSFALKPRETQLVKFAPSMPSCLPISGKEDGPESVSHADSSVVSSSSCSAFATTTVYDFSDIRGSASNLKTSLSHFEVVRRNYPRFNSDSNFSGSFNGSCDGKAIKPDPSAYPVPFGNTSENCASYSSLSPKSTDLYELRNASATVIVGSDKESLHTTELPKSTERQSSHKASSTSHSANDFTGSCTKIRNKSTPATGGSHGFKTSIRKVVQHLRPSKSSKSLKSCEMLFPYDLFVKLYNEKVELHPRGLANTGNSCYANAVIQCLTFTHPLTAYFLQGYHRKSCLKQQRCFTCEVENLVVKMKQNIYPLSPSGILSHVQDIGHQLGHGKEEDAHEFLRCSIDAMQSTCLEEVNTKTFGPLAEETTLLHHVFGGYLQSKIECMRCHSISECLDRIMDLIVDIHGDVCTLVDALRQFTHPEILDGDNKYFCKRCKYYEKAKKQLTIMEPPNILTIVMKRFQAGNFGKIDKMVKFPEVLNLAPYMSNQDDKTSTYNLYAVIEHLDSMNNTFSGHYICYVKDTQGKWYEANDNMVTAINLEKVLSRQAYILLYARSSPRSSSKIIARDVPRTVSDDFSQAIGSSDVMDVFEPSSDSSSLLSSSDEGSSSTDSTRYSISTEDYDHSSSEYDSSGWYSPRRWPNDPSTHSSPYSGSVFTDSIDTMRECNYPDAMPVGSFWHRERSFFELI